MTANLIPQDLSAEAATAGAVLISNKALATVADLGVRADDFYDPRIATVVQEALAMFAEGLPVDELTMVQRLAERGLDTGSVNAQLVMSLAERCPTAANVAAYARQVVDTRRRRDVYNAANAMLEAVADGGTAEKVEARAGESALRIGARLDNASSGATSLVSAVNDFYDDLSDRHRNGGAAGVATGYRELDGLLNGLQPGRLYVLAARPGMGKTAFAMNIVISMAARERMSIAFFSLEMTKGELAGRVLSAAGGVNGARLNGVPDDDVFSAVQSAAGSVRDMPGEVHIDDTPGVTAHYVVSACRRLVQRQRAHQAPPLGAVVVDYIGLMQGGAKFERKDLEIAHITGSLKALAKQLQIPVLALAQLNRGVDSREDKRPRLSDLRDSGSVEQDADAVMFLYREGQYNQHAANPDLTEVLVAKNRAGQANKTVPLIFEGRFTRFKEVPV